MLLRAFATLLPRGEVTELDNEAVIELAKSPEKSDIFGVNFEWRMTQDSGLRLLTPEGSPLFNKGEQRSKLTARAKALLEGLVANYPVSKGLDDQRDYIKSKLEDSGLLFGGDGRLNDQKISQVNRLVSGVLEERENANKLVETMRKVFEAKPSAEDKPKLPVPNAPNGLGQ